MAKRLILVLMLAALGCVAQAQSKGVARAFAVKVVGQGAPMILIPGLSSDGAVWDDTVAHYKDHYQCHVLTLAGFAGQPAMDGPFLASVRDQLVSYIGEKHLDHPMIVGHSLGGLIALWLATQHPELPGRLIIVDSLPALGATMNPAISQEQLTAGAARVRDSMLNVPEAQRLQYQKASIETMVTRPADIDRIYGWAEKSDAKAVAYAMYDVMATDLRGDLAKITAPTLVLGTWIAYEKYATQEQILGTFQLQYKNLKGARIEMAPTARHFIMYDQPEWMQAKIDSFLAPAARQ